MKVRGKEIDSRFTGSIVVVTNKVNLTRNYSKFIDSCDIVVRNNKLCNVSSGLAGERVDLAVIAYTRTYCSYTDRRKHASRLRDAQEVLFFTGPKKTPHDVDIFAKRHAISNYSMMSSSFLAIHGKLTTSTMAVVHMLLAYPLATVYMLGETDLAGRNVASKKHSSSNDDFFLQSAEALGIVIPILEEDLPGTAKGLYSVPVK